MFSFCKKSPNKLLKFHKWRLIQPKGMRIIKWHNDSDYEYAITPGIKKCDHCNEVIVKYHTFWELGQKD